MNEKKVYVVVGSTGEYSDHREWYVKVFLSRVKAEAFVEAVSAEYRTIRGKYDSYYKIPDGLNLLDPAMQIDYTGTNYNLVEVKLDTTQPSPRKKRIAN